MKIKIGQPYRHVRYNLTGIAKPGGIPGYYQLVDDEGSINALPEDLEPIDALPEKEPEQSIDVSQSAVVEQCFWPSPPVYDPTHETAAHVWDQVMDDHDRYWSC